MRFAYIPSLLLIVLSLTGCFDPDADTVRTGTLHSCPNTTVGKMAESFMDDPTWKSLTADDGKKYVNLSGGIMFHDKPADAVVQFLLNDDLSFEFNAFELNGLPQNQLIASALVEKMCASASEESDYNSELKRLLKKD